MSRPDPTPGRPTSWRTMLATGCALSAVLEARHPEARDRRIFHAGSAAHAYLEAVVAGEDPEVAVMRLATAGLGDGHTAEPTEPPMSVHAAHEGIDVARGFLGAGVWERVEGCDDPIVVDPSTGLPEGARAEAPVALDSEGRPCAWDDAAHRTRLDLVWTAETGGYEDDWGDWVPARHVVYCLDYKSSWQARSDADHAANIQRRYQALAALALHPEATEVVCMIGSLRERRVYATPPVERDAPILADWLREIQALEAVRAEARPAPGPGCSACTVAHLCPAEPLESDDRVVRWAAARGVVSSLDAWVRDRLARETEIRAGGSVLRLTPSTRRRVRPGAVSALVGRLAPEGGWGDLEERVASILAESRPGVTSVTRLAKHAIRLTEGVRRIPRARTDEALADLVYEVQSPRLSVEADPAGTDEGKS